MPWHGRLWGQFCYARHEHDDGLATIAWIKQQHWFSGELVTTGASYLGFTQRAMAADAGESLKAMVPQVSASDLNHYRFRGGSLKLEVSMSWATRMTLQAEPDGSLRLSIEFWPTAYHFRKGERLRVQVSSGAHPRFMRNLGSGEPLATGTRLVVADQTVYHDPLHPSAIVLPVLSRA